MAPFLFRLSFTALLGLLALSGTALAQSFQYADAANGGLALNFTLNLSTNVILSGTGTATSAYWSGVEDLVLVTQNTLLPAGNGQITSAGLPHVFNWVGVTNAGGSNFTGDDYFGASIPYVDSNGLIFEIVDPSTQSIVGGLHFWADSNLSTFSDVVAGAGSLLNTSATGTSTGALAPAPEPAEGMLLLAGLVLLGVAARKRAVV